MGSFPEGDGLTCHEVLQVLYEVELHTSCVITVSVQSLGQGTHLVLAVLQAVFLSLKKSGMLSLTKERRCKERAETGQTF